MISSFIQRLEVQWDQGKFVCVGLDPVLEKLPEDLRGYAQVRNTDEDIASCLAEAMVRVIDATHDIAAAFKPNTAPYERYGSQGWRALERVVAHAKETGVPVILDGKRGDIGATNEHYAAMAFDRLNADALTIPPYLGWQANKPFLNRADRGIIVLCRTSNPGAEEFQDYEVLVHSGSFPMYEGESGAEITGHTKIVSKVFRRVAEHVSNPETWNQNGNCCLVTGGTYPGEIGEVRRLAPHLPFLIPGIGKQGGDLEASVRAAEHRFLINSSSGITEADNPRQATQDLDQQVRQIRSALV